MAKQEKIIKTWILMKESWELYTKNLLKFIEVFLLGLVGALPFFAIIFLLSVYSKTELGIILPVLANILISFGLIILLGVSLYIAIIYSLKSNVASILLLKNNSSSAKDNFKASQTYINRFFAVSILNIILVIAWGFLFFIPALIFGVYYCFATYISVLEEKRSFTAIQASYDLVKGYWWPIFGRLLAITTIFLGFFFIISTPLLKMSEGSLPYIFYNLFVNIIIIIITPYFTVYFYKLYQSLKKVSK